MAEPSELPKQSLEQLQREIMQERKFSLAEAIGRLAGPGMMKGVSPATGKQQAEAQIEKFLEQHLSSPAGALAAVLFRHIRESELLLNNFDQPFVVLASCVQEILNSEFLLHDLVRQADCEWGRVYGERPYFEKSGGPAHEDDQYTVESVRATLINLNEELTQAIADQEQHQ